MSEPHPTTPDPAPSQRRRRRRDLAHLNPAKVRIGGTGIFAGAWALDDDNRYPVGYVGVLDRRWNGWAVFTCTRDVAAAIVTDHTRTRDTLQDRFIAAGHTDDQAVDMAAASTASLWWDGDDVIHDERGLTGDPDALHRYPPDLDGHYIICGGTWIWEPVPPRACDRIVGDLPARGEQQQWLPLTHSDLRMPHGRLTVTDLTVHDTGSDTGGVTVATLTLDGTDFAILTVAPGGAQDWPQGPDVTTGWQLEEFVAACRYRGRAATAYEVLDALVNEAQTVAYLAAAEHAQATVVRLCNTDGRTLDLQPVPAGSDIADLRAAFAVRSDPETDGGGGAWEIWSGHSWDRFYEIPAADSDTTATGAQAP